MDFGFLIPARSGSKRIPGKNTKLFLGRPIITYPVQTALSSGLGPVWVSSDDPGVVAGIDGVRYLPRPPELCDDTAEIEQVVEHFLLQVDAEWVGLLYPTSVFCSASDLTTCYGLCLDAGHEVAMSVVACLDHPQTTMTMTKRGLLVFADGRYAAARSQDLIPHYVDAAQFYIMRSQAFLTKWQRDLRIKQMEPYAYLYARSSVQDIDTPEDWEEAEAKYRRIHGVT